MSNPSDQKVLFSTKEERRAVDTFVNVEKEISMQQFVSPLAIPLELGWGSGNRMVLRANDLSSEQVPEAIAVFKKLLPGVNSRIDESKLTSPDGNGGADIFQDEQKIFWQDKDGHVAIVHDKITGTANVSVFGEDLIQHLSKQGLPYYGKGCVQRKLNQEPAGHDSALPAFASSFAPGNHKPPVPRVR